MVTTQSGQIGPRVPSLVVKVSKTEIDTVLTLHLPMVEWTAAV